MSQKSRVGSYAELVDQHATALLRLAVMLTGNPADAEDLLQATLLRCVRHGERIAAMEAPAAYLRRALVNEHISRGRWSARRVRTVPVPAGHPEPAARQDQTVDDRDEAWRWLATLPPKQRAVLVLRFYEDLPDDEIADLLGITPGTVRSNAARGLDSLRGRLKEQP